MLRCPNYRFPLQALKVYYVQRNDLNKINNGGLATQTVSLALPSVKSTNTFKKVSKSAV